MMDRYLVDTVTLSRLTPNQRAAAFIRNRCRIPQEILFEASGLPDIEALKLLNYAVTTVVLDNVKIVTASLKTGDKVVDLYSNKGNGDVMLLATALTEMAVSAGQLIGDRWVIATDDEGLTTKAAELGVATCTTNQFIALMAQSG